MNDHLLAIVPAALTFLIGALGLMIKMWSSIRGEFEKSRQESDERARLTHERIENLRDHIGENFVANGAYAADQRRIDDAFRERDQQMAELNDRLNCPATQMGLSRIPYGDKNHGRS